MKQFIVFNREGHIKRTGTCSNDLDMELQVSKSGEFIAEGAADSKTDKIQIIEVDDKNNPTKIKITKKTEKEKLRDNPIPSPVDYRNRPANITNGAWTTVLHWITELQQEVKSLKEA